MQHDDVIDYNRIMKTQGEEIRRVACLLCTLWFCRSRTSLTVTAILRFVKGLVTKALIPAVLALSASIREPRV
jgi:hypothetical protein